MKQIKLEIDSLDIQSFTTAPEPVETRGTVRAHVNTLDEGCTSFAECGGTQGCNTASFDCTWYPELQCYSNAIAYPTEPRCDRNCRLTSVCG